jgi:hypothetical protein
MLSAQRDVDELREHTPPSKAILNTTSMHFVRQLRLHLRSGKTYKISVRDCRLHTRSASRSCQLCLTLSIRRLHLNATEKLFHRAPALFFRNGIAVQTVPFPWSVNAITPIHGGMPSLCSNSQDRRATKNIAANGSGLDEACRRS